MNKVSYQITRNKFDRQKPKVPIRLTNPLNGESLTVLALVDSGSDCCTLPSMVSRTLGLDLDSESKSEKGTRGISGEELNTYKHVLRIDLLDESRRNIVRSLNVVVNTIEINDLPPILGTYMFLEEFNIGLNYLYNTIDFNW